MSSTHSNPAQQATLDIEGGEAEATSEQADVEPLPLDIVFELLRNERRRRVLRYLVTESPETTLGDLADHIAALENDTDEQQLTAQQRKRVYVGLYQCHLPKMADSDVIEFDQNRGTVEIGETAPQLLQYLGSEEEEEPSTDPTYLLFGTGAAAVVYAATYLTAAEPTWLADVVVLGILCAVSLYTYIDGREADE